MLMLHVADVDLIPTLHIIPWAPLGVDPEHRPEESLEHFGVWLPNEQKSM